MPRLNGVKKDYKLQTYKRTKNDYPKLSKLSKIYNINNMNNVNELHNMNKISQLNQMLIDRRINGTTINNYPK